MSLIINTNLNSLYSQNDLTQNSTGLNAIYLSLNSGITTSIYGFAVGASLSSQIAATSTAIENNRINSNLIDTAQGATLNILNDLTALNSLAVQAANGTNSDEDRAALNTQYQALVADISRIASTTTFNGVSLLSGGSLQLQLDTGTSTSDSLIVNLPNGSTGSLGLNLDTSSIDTADNALAALSTVNNAIQLASTSLASLGAYDGAIASNLSNLTTKTESLSQSRSSLLDTNFGQSLSDLIKMSLLTNANASMLTQANANAAIVLQLLS